MFETVVPETVTRRSRALMYSTLPVSIVVHTIAVAGVLVGQAWNVQFPAQSPKLYLAYSLIEPPPPPPPPPPPVTKPVPVAQPVARVAPVKMPLVAPPFIPDEIPVVEVDEAPPPAVMVPVDAVPTGVDGGLEGGEVGGDIGGTIGGLKAMPLPDLVKIERDLPLPMSSVSQEFPAYPEYAKTRGWEDRLVVRYVIDKRGRVKDVQVIEAPERDEFARAAIGAIKHWRFQPFRDTDGTPKEVSHELTVEFKIVRGRIR